jgi:DNA-binding transcriptional ArsR family regulator
LINLIYNVTNRLHIMRRDVFQALADPNRRAILTLLAAQKLTLNGVAEHFTISRPAISKHIRILAECGLVVIRAQGRERVCEVRPARLNEVSEWIEQYRQIWDQRMDRLEQYLKELSEEEKNSIQNKKSLS